MIIVLIFAKLVVFFADFFPCFGLTLVQPDEHQVSPSLCLCLYYFIQ